MKIVNNIPKGNVKAPHGAKLRVSSNGQTNFNEKFSNSEEFEIVFTPENKDESGKDLYLRNGISQDGSITIGVEAKADTRVYNLADVLSTSTHYCYSVGGLYRHIWATEPNLYDFFQSADQITQITYTEGLTVKQYVYIPQEAFKEDSRFVNYTDGAFASLFIRPYKPITITGNSFNDIKLATNVDYFIKTTNSQTPPLLSDLGILTLTYGYTQDGGVPGQTFMCLDSEGGLTISGKTSKSDEKTPNANYTIEIQPDNVWGNGVTIGTSGAMTIGASNLSLGDNISFGKLKVNTTQIIFPDFSHNVDRLNVTVLSPDFLLIKLSDQWTGAGMSSNIDIQISDLGSVPSNYVYRSIGERRMILDTKTKRFSFLWNGNKIPDWGDNYYLFVNSDFLPAAN